MAVTDLIALQDAEAFIVATLTARDPSLDLRAGTPQYDIYVRPFISLVADILDRVAAAERKRTLLNFTDLTTDEADAMAARYFTYRFPGSKATGSIRVKFLARQAFSMATTSPIIVNDLSYLPVTDLNVLASDLKYDEVEKVYYYDFYVEAEEIGPDYAVTAGTPVSIPTLDGPNLASAIVSSSINGGQAAESNQSLYSRVQRNQVVKNLVSSLSIEAVLKEQFPTIIQSILVVGHQEPEMLRDAIDVMDPVMGRTEIHVGGHVDVYLRTPMVRESIEFKVSPEASLVNLEAYHPVLKIHSVKIKGQEDSSPYWELVAQDPRYRYSAEDQSALFIDPGAAETTIVVDMTYAPDIKRIHNYCQSDAVRLTLANLLVRHKVPVWLSGNIYVEGATGLQDEMGAAVAAYLQGLGPDQPVIVSKMTEAIHLTGARVVQQDYEIHAQAVLGNGEVIEFADDVAIHINSSELQGNIFKGLSARNSFFVDEGILITNL